MSPTKQRLNNKQLTFADGLGGTPVNKLFMLIGLQSKPASSNTQHQHRAGKHTLLHMTDGHAFHYMPSADEPSERLGYAAQHWKASVPDLARRLELDPLPVLVVDLLSSEQRLHRSTFQVSDYLTIFKALRCLSSGGVGVAISEAPAHALRQVAINQTLHASLDMMVALQGVDRSLGALVRPDSAIVGDVFLAWQQNHASNGYHETMAQQLQHDLRSFDHQRNHTSEVLQRLRLRPPPTPRPPLHWGVAQVPPAASSSAGSVDLTTDSSPPRQRTPPPTAGVASSSSAAVDLTTDSPPPSQRTVASSSSAAVDLTVDSPPPRQPTPLPTAGPSDAGPSAASPSDAGPSDAGPSDDGPSDFISAADLLRAPPPVFVASKELDYSEEQAFVEITDEMGFGTDATRLILDQADGDQAMLFRLLEQQAPADALEEVRERLAKARVDVGKQSLDVASVQGHPLTEWQLQLGVGLPRGHPALQLDRDASRLEKATATTYPALVEPVAHLRRAAKKWLCAASYLKSLSEDADESLLHSAKEEERATRRKAEALSTQMDAIVAQAEAEALREA